MKVQQLFEADKPEEIVWDLSELEGKKMNREKAIKFVAKLPHVENNAPNKSIFEVKKGVKFNMAKLIKLLNAMDPSISAYKWPGSTRKFHLDFNYNHPVKGKILYSPPTHDEFMALTKEQREDAKKKVNELTTELHAKEKAALKSDKASAGWYMTHNANDWFTDLICQFVEGPSKGRYFKVGKPYKSDLKIGDEIEVTYDPTYGRVKVKK